MNITYPEVIKALHSMLTVEMLGLHCSGAKPIKVMVPWDIMSDPENPQWEEFNVEVLPSRAGSPDPSIRESAYDYATILLDHDNVKLVICRRCPPPQW